MERVKGIEPSYAVQWFTVVSCAEFPWLIASSGVYLLALLALCTSWGYGLFVQKISVAFLVRRLF
ncbi:MAG: hypothetical protein JWP89_4390 [Schlesneria sp.]|nr:hypothetical protein [Schlesneria sp.]